MVFIQKNDGIDMIANVEKKMHSNAPTYNANSREPLLFSRKNKRCAACYEYFIHNNNPAAKSRK